MPEPAAPPDRRRPTGAYLGLATAALLWSGNFVVGRALRDQIAPLPLNFWRWVIALVILLVLAWRPLRAHRVAVLRHWKLIAALGLTGIAAFHTCVYLALATSTAVNALLLLVMTPLLVVFGSWMAFGERVTSRQALGLGVSLAGAVLLIAHGELATLARLELRTGDLWMLLAVALWTVYSLLLRKRPAELPQVVLLAASTIAAVALMLPLYAWTLFDAPARALDTPGLWGLAYVAVMASVVAFWLWNSGVARIGPSRATTFLYLMPFFGAVLSFVFLGEGLQPYQLAAGALIFAGIALTNRRGEGDKT